ncbi:permease prefix domain 1-containing protein [Lactiplantibacillus carotarum]|uniref:permease prefix domain 1-containing protein n=1 Tax=Lactiplantibacillus carotarum TaxID=2993456 RepID=UPI00298F1008|nr:permease prefix domain 1-containing protein [Lactiplantibacillus carotarum]
MSAKIEQLVAMRLNSYFKNQPETPALTELRTELATDLNEAANDKERTGLDPEAAVAEAFSDFGDINELIEQVNAENGTTKTVHGHHVVMDDEGISVDDGETLKINGDGIYLKGGQAFKADADGLSINNGAIKADSHGLKLGNWTFDENGVNLNGNAQARPDFNMEGRPFNLAGEYLESLPLVNEQRFDVAGVTSLALAYKSARVKIIPTQADGDEIIVREYMNHNNTTYQAQVSQRGTSLQVVQGKVPFLIPLRVHVQIHVPVNFAGDLTIESRSGSVLLAGLTSLNVVNLKVESGGARLAELRANALSADIVSGGAN